MRKQIKPPTQSEKRRQITDRLRVAPELSDRQIAKMLGVSPTTVGSVRRELADKTVQNGQVDTGAYDWTNHPYIMEHPDILDGLSGRSIRAIKTPGVLDKMMERGSRSPRYCQRLLYKECTRANKNPLLTVTEEDVEVFVDDIRTGLPQIKDESVDLIFVDPPYDVKTVEELYSHISTVAGRILREGGSLLVLCGGANLDKAIVELSTDKRLRYNWTLAYVCKSNGSPLIHSRNVATAVKHVLWYVKGKYEGKMVYDLIEAPPDPDGTDKTYHKWGQSVEGVKELLRRLTKDGDVICDIMCGGGSTVVAALELGGRRVIACDVDEEAVRTTRLRVRRLFGHDR
ncbi:DNA methyltransferase [Gudongella oleilytica]|uniref:DNA methyltransferase n=1 Tax=Gudongella oleilytica TaxID=1582259 RepID=UPI0013E8F26C|nr:DNA methyltransferase [Gudongella oleilytica]